MIIKFNIPGLPALARNLTAWFCAALAAWLLQTSMAHAEGVAPRYFAAKPGSLVKAKQRLAAGDKSLAKALKNLLAEADEGLKEKPPTVTAKTKVPPSGDRHDYMSLAPYYWPNPDSKAGLPYHRHDGRVNPESRDPRMNDGPRLKLMGNTMETLALAYYFTGEEKYAARAAKFARVWFLDPATRMNPHLKYAQAVRGVNEGRGTGIIEGRPIAMAADGLGLLAGSKSWTAADQAGVDAWLAAYLDWLLTSDAGKYEGAAKNNHGTIFDAQTARLALCLGRVEAARRILEDAKPKRIAAQIEPDGRQPLELARTNSLGYSRLNIEALCDLATLGEHAGVDLWGFQTADGRSIRRALEFLLPFVIPPAKPWPYPQSSHRPDPPRFLSLLRQVALGCNAPDLESVVAKDFEARNERFQLLFVK